MGKRRPGRACLRRGVCAGNEPEGPFSKLTIHPLFFILFGCRVESGVSLHRTTLLQRVVYITHSVRNMY